MSIDYLKIRNEEVYKNQREWMLFGSIYVYIYNKLSENINIRYVLNRIEYILPKEYTKFIEAIYISKNNELKRRNINALYENGCIFLSNNQKSNEEMVTSIIHEIGHSIEEEIGLELYSDNFIKEEFLSKRILLYSILSEYCKGRYEIPSYLEFIDTEYNKELDDFLYKKIEYSLLKSLTLGFVIEPYAMLSLKEYFATYFEYYFTKVTNEDEIKRMGPRVYKKIENIKEKL